MAASNPIAGERKRFTVEEVERMAQAGLLDGQDLELIDGDLLVRPSQSPPHSATKGRLRLLLEDAYRSADRGVAHVRDQDPLRVGDLDQPQPDLAIVPGTPSDYEVFHPLGSKAILVVEVSASSVAYDRAKLAVYARGLVPVVWIVNLDDRVLEIYSEPRNGRYTKRSDTTDGEVELPATSTRLAVNAIFP